MKQDGSDDLDQKETTAQIEQLKLSRFQQSDEQLRIIIEQKDSEIYELQKQLLDEQIQKKVYLKDNELLVEEQKRKLKELDQKIHLLMKENNRLNEFIQKQQLPAQQSQINDGQYNQLTASGFSIIADMELRVQELAEENKILGLQANKYKQESEQYKHECDNQHKQIKLGLNNSSSVHISHLNPQFLQNSSKKLKQNQLQKSQQLPCQQNLQTIQLDTSTIPPIASSPFKQIIRQNPEIQGSQLNNSYLKQQKQSEIIHQNMTPHSSSIQALSVTQIYQVSKKTTPMLSEKVNTNTGYKQLLV